MSLDTRREERRVTREGKEKKKLCTRGRKVDKMEQRDGENIKVRIK